MCPPNQLQPGFNEEDTELFNLDLATICDAPLFNTLFHGSPGYTSYSSNESSFSPIEKEGSIDSKETS